MAAGDVKLANLIVDVDRLRGRQGPLVKLVDFGLSATPGTAHLCWALL